MFFYQGPGIPRTQLGGKKTIQDQKKQKEELITIEEVKSTELMRSFVNHDGVKKTHVISVASPEGLHYSYDLHNAALLHFWRGKFADVTNMWKNRGEAQTLISYEYCCQFNVRHAIILTTERHN